MAVTFLTSGLAEEAGVGELTALRAGAGRGGVEERLRLALGGGLGDLRRL